MGFGFEEGLGLGFGLGLRVREAPMPRQTKPIEKNMSALNSRMKLTSWNSSVRSMQQKITWLG